MTKQRDFYPFMTNSTWYEAYWLTDVPVKPRRSARLRGFLFGLLQAWQSASRGPQTRPALGSAAGDRESVSMTDLLSRPR